MQDKKQRDIEKRKAAEAAAAALGGGGGGPANGRVNGSTATMLAADDPDELF